MSDHKDSLPTLDAKIVSDIVDAVLTSAKITMPSSKASLKDYISQTENDDHDLSVNEVVELYNLIHSRKGPYRFYDLTDSEQDAEVEVVRAAFDLGRDGIEELREALAEADENVKQLEEEASRPLEMSEFEKKHLDFIQSQAWKAAVEWINQQGSEAIDLEEMEAANPYEPDIFPPTEHGTVIAGEGSHLAIETKNGLEFLTLTYQESSDSWVGVEDTNGTIRRIDTKDIKPGTWEVVK